ncbi:MAG: AraC family transcriptional regulator [Dechloromonas sp.]|nr:AraC family transcriptional regulator [Thauera sp.]MBN8461315.1 AraC family transcriptional regulator [Dechloromonas sp.]
MPRHIAPPAHESADTPDIHVVRRDADGARSWMSAICGPHWLKVGAPARLQFQHSGNVLKSMSTTMGYVEYGTDVTVGIDTETPLNCYSVSLPVTGQQELAARGTLLTSDRDTGVIVSPDARQELTIAGNCRKMLVAIPRLAMRQVLEELLQRPAEKPIEFEPGMDAANGRQASWWRMVRHMIAEMESSSADLYGNTYFSADLEKALIKGLVLTQPSNYSVELAQALETKQPHYLLRARDFIHANARTDIALEDIEAVAGVPRYKLFEGFRQHFGLSPMAYLKKFRLEQVRRSLLSDGGHGNVSSIAMDWGFNHLGRFSAEYRRLFDESPSQTLSRHLAKNRP